MLRECFFFSSRRRHTRCSRDWSSDVCPSDLIRVLASSTSSRWDNLGTLRGACRNTWHKCGHEALGRSASPYESRKGYSSTRYALLLKYHIFRDRKSTRLNSSHGYISYAVFCLKKQSQIEYLVCSNHITGTCRDGWHACR